MNYNMKQNIWFVKMEINDKEDFNLNVFVNFVKHSTSKQNVFETCEYIQIICVPKYELSQ